MEEQTGGKGGDAASYRYSSSWQARYAGGGAGNTGGVGKYTFSGQTTGANWEDGRGQNGTGGLLIIYTDSLANNGEISANGMVGGAGYAPGGSSGGGSVNIFTNAIKERGSIIANGGAAKDGKGGKGGDGTVTINQLKPDLSYEPDTIYLNLGESHSIDSSKVTYINQNGIQTPILNMGALRYESLDNEIATVDDLGKITAKNYGTTKIKIIDTANEIETYITITVIRVLDSIVQGFRDNDLADGIYKIAVNNQLYDVEIINYYDDVKYSLAEGETSKTISLGDKSSEYRMLVVKYHKNLIIDEGVTLTANTALDENGAETNLTYKKGMYICVMGDIINKGNISMTARGTYNHEGENVYLWKNIDNSYEYVPAIGGAGGAGIKSTRNQAYVGNKGADGTIRATGGGAGGASVAGDEAPTCYSGSGSQGTSYSVGTGGGGVDGNFRNTSISAENAKPNRRKRWKCIII